MNTKINKLYVIGGVALLIALLIGIIVYQYKTIQKKDSDIKIKENNIEALTDSVRIKERKNGELEFAKRTLILEKDELKKLFPKLHEETKKSGGKVSEITESIISVKDDKKRKGKNVVAEIVKNSIESDTIKEKPTYLAKEYRLPWVFDTIYDKDNYTKISGETFVSINDSSVYGYSNLINSEFNLNVVQGLRKKDDKLEVFVTSRHPNFRLTDMTSIIIDPKEHVINEYVKPTKPKWNVSLFAGYGFDNKLETTWFIGAGFGRTIFSF